MTRYNALLLVMGLLIGANGAFAQEKSQLVGTWTFVSSTSKNPDGSPAWGANPKGIVIFTENGRYSSHVMRSDRPKRWPRRGRTPRPSVGGPPSNIVYQRAK